MVPERRALRTPAPLQPMPLPIVLRRRDPRPERQRRSGRVRHHPRTLIAIAAILAGLSGAAAYTMLAGSRAGAGIVIPRTSDIDRLVAWAGLGLEEVSLTGHRFTSDLDVFDALDLPNAHSFVAFDTGAARARIERLPWVATAAITRVYPGQLEVRITERTPFALWQRDGRHQLIDATGRVLSAVKPEDYPRLPRFSGEGAAVEAASLVALVDRHPDLRARLLEAERVGERRWTLHLQGNVTLHLPADREAVALGEVAASDGLKAIIEGRDRIVDLRASRRITTRPAPIGDSRAAGGSAASGS